MRVLATLALLALGPGAAQAQTPPHAVLFGTWAGGLYPVLNTQLQAECRAEPAFRVQGDLVSRASLIDPGMQTRTISTVRVVPGGFEIQFAPQAGAVGFGCDSPDVLYVQRAGPEEITFPGCADFPNPLVRCR